VLLDLRMPGADGYAGVALLHAEMPAVPILVVSSAEAAEAAAAVQRFGAVGFIGKDQDLATIETAITAALTGARLATPIEPDLDAVARDVAALTPTQLRVLLGVLAGRLNKQIAHDLGISEATVKAHMTAIMRKLDVQNRTQAVLAARALGLA
jgi:DNA-binding NarL/FixJ family response regulator